MTDFDLIESRLREHFDQSGEALQALTRIRARVVELEEHRQGAERLIDRLIETCPEARQIIAEFALEALKH